MQLKDNAKVNGKTQVLDPTPNSELVLMWLEINHYIPQVSQ